MFKLQFMIKNLLTLLATFYDIFVSCIRRSCKSFQIKKKSRSPQVSYAKGKPLCTGAIVLSEVVCGFAYPLVGHFPVGPFSWVQSPRAVDPNVAGPPEAIPSRIFVIVKYAEFIAVTFGTSYPVVWQTVFIPRISGNRVEEPCFCHKLFVFHFRTSK